MSPLDENLLTDRQRRELEYHREHAKANRKLLAQNFSWDVLTQSRKRWWNAYWQMYAFLTQCDLTDKEVLVVGCGFGDDALRLAKLGAKVTAFDLSADSLAIARQLAQRENLRIAFDQMPAESIHYATDHFDCIVVRDILHHVDIPKAMRELTRVAKPNALFVVDEIYTHSMADRIRHSNLIAKIVYPHMQRFIYGEGRPYITQDERKLNERDIREISRHLSRPESRKYFDFLATRIFPSRYVFLAKLDRLLLLLLSPLAPLIAGRILFVSKVLK